MKARRFRYSLSSVTSAYFRRMRIPPASRLSRPGGLVTSRPLGEQQTDHALRLLVGPFADVAIAHDALAVHEDERGPRADAVALPDGKVVVLHDRIPHVELAGGFHHLVVRLLPGELRTVYAHDGQSGSLEAPVPVPQLRDHVLAVVSAVRPE